ncbi:MAG: hypothetical protein L0Z55_01215 [Planctomycetes bacterium]|nr:hypothetical protein [Planctomycetota bacterium]
MTSDFTNLPASQNKRRPYRTPELVVHGSMEKLTGWIGGTWGEFFGGTNGLDPLGDDPLGGTGS